jgi:hypothetical protein
MNDEFLSQHTEEPRPEFARDLFKRINRPTALPDAGRERRRVRWAPACAAAAAIAGLAIVVVNPTARAAAQDFLDMFRVKRFAAVSIDPARIEQLRNGKVDMQTMLGDSVEVIKDPGSPVTVGSVREASDKVGMPLLVPTYVFNVGDAPRLLVSGDRVARYTADAQRLQEVADLVGISDVQVPQALDGAQVTVRVPASVVMRYEKNGNWIASFVQAPSPSIELPKGVDMAQLGEIGLRIAGLSAAEARSFAAKIDWNSTLLVPVPANAASFREVDVRGTTGLMIEIDTRRSPRPADTRGSERPRSVLLWSEGNNVYSIASTMDPVDVLEMANALQNE